ncbi:hypothetical protein [Synechococcus sp. UW105]|uniref:hypothetical protein n=1 Tax=Synechococcus sp. UW105 TaxID=337067 RepID=UPI000E0F0DB3|nr:hypothetical protein [Synechococcus sp. UW105]
MISLHPISNPKRLWLLAGLAPLVIAAPLHGQAQDQVIWQPVSEEQADQLQILVPSDDGGANSIQPSPSESQEAPQPSAPQPIIWEVVPDAESSDPSTTNPSRSTEVVWEQLPKNPSVAADGANNGPTSSIVWEVLPDTIAPIAPEAADTIAGVESVEPPGDSTASASEGPPSEVIAQEAAMPARMVPGPPPPAPLQALNRSIAYGDGLVGPDISLRIPNGFRWSQRWFGDVSVLGYDYQNGRNPGDPFIPARDSGNLDGWAIIHANILQTKNWSVALNTSFRSLQNNPDIPGGSTGIEDGVSSGFRIARSIGDTSGIAFGGEQVIQWDDNTDTGRNLYLMASKGWWLGHNGKDYPLFIANGGFGTGRFASLTDKDEFFNFTCMPVEQNRKVAQIDENLCWGPIGSVSLVVNEWWGTFVEYAIGRATFGVSSNITGEIPLRLTAGVHFVENDEVVSFDELRWIAQFSLGF